MTPVGPVSAVIEQLTGRARPKSAILVRGDRSAYELLAVLDVGANTAVLRGRDRATGRAVAIKVLTDEPRLGLSAATKRFAREVQLLGRLRHPHIVGATDRGELGTRPFYVMDLAVGGSLGRRLRERGRLPAPAAVGYVLEVLDALGYAHEFGVVHRDVKPDNILLDDADVARLVDFGIALDPTDERSTAYGECLGTPAYISPEQVEDAAAVGPRADLFGAGATLLALATGMDPLALVSGGHRETALAAVPEALREVVDKATRPHAADRYGSATEMSLALADASEALLVTP